MAKQNKFETQIALAEAAGKKITSPAENMIATVPKTITSVEQYSQAARVFQSVKDLEKALAAEYGEIIVPLREGLDKLYAKHREARAPLEVGGARIKLAMEKFDEKKTSQAVVRAEKAADKRGASAEEKRDASVRAAATSHAPTVAGITTISKWDYEVTDLEAVPAYVNGVEIRAIKKASIQKLIRAVEGKIEIPGVKNVFRKVKGARSLCK